MKKRLSRWFRQRNDGDLRADRMLESYLGTEARLSSLGPLAREAPRQYQFGEYTLDLERGFLCRGTHEIALRAKSFEVLVYLVQRHGRLVTKAELIEAVWPDSAVTDNSLAQCLFEIRRALDDEAQKLIRTVARRGYLFAAEVATPPTEFAHASGEGAPVLVPTPVKRPYWKVLGAAVLVLAFAAAGILFSRARRPGENQPAAYVQLTSFTDAAVAPALSPDGRMVAFFRSDRSFLSADQVYVKLLPNGEAVQLTHDPRLKYHITFSPDGSKIAYTVFDADQRGVFTYTVSSLGGESKLFLPNSAGLTWLDDHHVLFSEGKKDLNLGLVTAAESRSDLREIYFPAAERGGVYYSAASPDRKWALVAESDRVWLPCRLVPFEGGSHGREVGPHGPCTSVAWSPDGNWMYFGVEVAGRRHLWRQRFPDGQPEQVTSGPTEEDGIAMAPDGRSLITSISAQQSAVWFHDAKGDRPISTEGYAATADESASSPSFSTDGKRLYYLFRRYTPESPTELWRTDTASGSSEAVVPGVSMREFDVSKDEKEVVFSTFPVGKPAQLWLAPLDRGAPPRMIASTGETAPHFGPDGEVLYQLTEANVNYLARMKRDGSGRSKVVPYPVIKVFNISPDRRFVISVSAIPKVPNGIAMMAIPAGGGPPRRVCVGLCPAIWSPDGKYFYVGIAPASLTNPSGKMVIIPVPAGETLPPLPATGVLWNAAGLTNPGIKFIEGNLIPGVDPSTYAYLKQEFHANLFRIPLP